MIKHALERFNELIHKELGLNICEKDNFVHDFDKRRLGGIPDNFPADLVQHIGEFIDPLIKYRHIAKLLEEKY